jgi:hypothetical protein
MRRRPLCVLSLVLLIGAASLASAPSAAGFPTHRCGAFIHEHEWDDGEISHFRVTVFNGNQLSCRMATKVIEAFWGPEETIKSHGGPSQAETYYTIRGWPGWRCYTGAGGGTCIRHHRVAGYLSATA